MAGPCAVCSTMRFEGISRPKRLSSDHDPLYRFHQWRANLRVLQVTEVKSVPSVPLSHPFVERLIGTRRRECVDQLLFWSASDLETNWWPSRTSTMRIGPMRRWTGGRPSRYERMSPGSTATDGTRIAVVSIRRRSRRDIGPAKTVASGSTRPRSTSIATQQGSASAARLTHAIATTSRGTPGSRDPKIERCRIPTNSPPTGTTVQDREGVSASAAVARARSHDALDVRTFLQAPLGGPGGLRSCSGVEVLTNGGAQAVQIVFFVDRAEIPPRDRSPGESTRSPWLRVTSWMEQQARNCCYPDPVDGSF